MSTFCYAKPVCLWKILRNEPELRLKFSRRYTRGKQIWLFSGSCSGNNYRPRSHNFHTGLEKQILHRWLLRSDYTMNGKTELAKKHMHNGTRLSTNIFLSVTFILTIAGMSDSCRIIGISLHRNKLLSRMQQRKHSGLVFGRYWFESLPDYWMF
jgi:hypothetical protein